jgi:uncharacterized protein YcbK (DUF882 family)
LTLRPEWDKILLQDRKEKKRVLPPANRPDLAPSPPKLIHRRRFLHLGILAAATVLFPPALQAAVSPAEDSERRLSFFNTHTSESLEVCYCRGGSYDPTALQAIDRILRDHRTGEVKSIDRELLDLLHVLSRRFESQRPFHVISGYRSPQTNALLRREGHGVACHSLHLCGKAIDIRVPGIHTCDLRDMARRLAAGGVGYYPGSDFVHVDTGRVRNW